MNNCLKYYFYMYSPHADITLKTDEAELKMANREGPTDSCDYIDPNTANPLYHNLKPQNGKASCPPPDTRSAPHKYQSLDPTRLNYTALYVTATNHMNLKESTQVMKEEQKKKPIGYCVIDKAERDEANMYTTVKV